MTDRDVPEEWIRKIVEIISEAAGCGDYDCETCRIFARQAIAAVAPLIRAAEMEECAKVAIGYPTPDDAGPHESHGRDMAAIGIAAAIRARHTKEATT